MDPLPVAEGSAAQQAAALLPDSTMVAAFHHVSVVLLLDPELDSIDLDVLVISDDRPATDLVQAPALASQLPSGEIATALTQPRWPVRVVPWGYVGGGLGRTPRSRPWRSGRLVHVGVAEGLLDCALRTEPGPVLAVRGSEDGPAICPRLTREGA